MAKWQTTNKRIQREDGLQLDCKDERAARVLAGHLTFLDWLKARDVDGHVSAEALSLAESRIREAASEVNRGHRGRLRQHLTELSNSHDFAERVVG